MTLSAEASALGQKLLEHHRSVCSSVTGEANLIVRSEIARCSIRYGVLCERAGLPFLRRSSGSFLYEIAQLCEKHGWPPINSLVVNESGLPGAGYDHAPGGGFAQWDEQVRRAIAFRGYPDVLPG